MQQLADEEKNVVLTIFDGAGQKMFSVLKGQQLLDVLRHHGFYASSPCGGRGTCGKCCVELRQGRILVVGDDNGSDAMCEAGTKVLACRSFLTEDCTVDVSAVQEHGFSSSADFVVMHPGEIESGFETLRFSPTAGVWNAGDSAVENIRRELARNLTFSPKALRQISCWLGEALKTGQAAPAADQPLFLMLCGDRVVQARTEEAATSYGIGIDLGTTTIALSLVELATGEVRKTTTLLNSQRQFGADVITRIQKGAEGLLPELRSCVREDISRGIKELCAEKATAVVRIVIAGNTTMLHLLLGLRADSLGLFPFQPVSTELAELSSAELFRDAELDCDVILLPAIGAFVGADIVAGMMYCEIEKSTAPALFVDVGTNGEMAIGGKDRIICTSTAAGPAFEGANITWGTGSIAGAIAHVDIRNGELEFQTIDDALPVGICGSAVLDIAAVCRREGLLDHTGLFTSEDLRNNGLRIAQTRTGEWIRFTQKDVREFQLAKAAIRSGLELLVQESGCRWEEIGRACLAGGFGARIDVANAVAVGLLPTELQDRIQPVGNAALGGTVSYLLSRQRREAVDALVRSSRVIDLSQQPKFNDLFLTYLQFPTGG
jgi:uncharacterized 2Fe-2S/4Fe-4S cluster protein (DUF4445 family)